MPTSIETLEAKWTAIIADITDELVAAEATYALERYIGALINQAALEAGTITSYSISGRSVTRRTVGEAQDAIRELRRELLDLCYGRTSLIDLNETADEP